MSISNVTATSSSSPLTASDFNQRKKNLDALEDALDSGDLGAAQSAFNTIQQDLKNMPRQSSAGQSAAVTQALSDFQQIGAALKSGDVDAAKQAFATWQQDMQQMRARRHHHGGQSGNGEQARQASPTATGSATSPTVSTFSATA
jgi:hypothetical protein